MNPKLLVAMIVLSLAVLIHGNTKILKIASNSYDDYYDDDEADDDSFQKDTYSQLQQLFVKGKEESPQNFIRLLVMRLIYGLAAQFGFEERLAGFFNGAFVPPNADNDYDGGGFFDGDFDNGVGGSGILDAIDL